MGSIESEAGHVKGGEAGGLEDIRLAREMIQPYVLPLYELT